MALPWRYRGGAPVVVLAQFRCISDDPLGVSGVRAKTKVSAPIRFVSDDPLSVCGCSRQSRPCRDAKPNSFGTISVRRVCYDIKSDDPYSERRVVALELVVSAPFRCRDAKK